jgi:uncharacterized repeat protein (TIGR03803 family)
MAVRSVRVGTNRKRGPMKNVEFAKIGFLVAVFCIAAVASRAQTFTSLRIFNGSNGNGPGSSLVQGTNGNFYGTTGQGGAHKEGNIFEITPTGEITTLYRFCAASGCPDGAGPVGALVQGSNGNFYGTTYGGGSGIHCPANSGGCGTVFEITPKGMLTTLYNFCSLAKCADGAYPRGLVQGVNGDLYGTTTGYNGAPTCFGVGRTGCGTVYAITLAGKLTTVHKFCTTSSCTDGYGPFAALTVGSDGNFYGTTVYGGVNAGGTAFQITPQGKLTTIYSFCSLANCSDGGQAIGALVLGNNGNLYGTTLIGGTNSSEDCNGIGCGTIFEITTAGQITTLYNFCAEAGCADGYWPEGALSLGSDGNFYGTTTEGGANGLKASLYGNIFELTSGGQFSSLYIFSCTATSCSDGALPIAGLLQSTNGTFYGTTATGGNPLSPRNLGDGVAYSWSMGLGPFVEAQSNFGKAGQIVTILGNDLSGATSVTFNGTPAKFKFFSDTYLKAEVPTAVTTGPIKVTTPGGALSSNVAFQVLP